MSQNYNLPVTGDTAETAIAVKTAQALEAVRTRFSGPTAPANPTAYQLWADTTNMLVMEWNPTAGDWIAVGALGANGQTTHMEAFNAPLVGPFPWTLRLPLPPSKLVVTELVIITDTAIAASSSDRYTFTLQNASQGDQALFSTTPDTNAIVSNVGGGAIPSNVAYTLTPDQNFIVQKNDLLELVIGSVGSPDGFGNIQIALRGMPRGD